jgi:hypothetical protein
MLRLFKATGRKACLNYSLSMRLKHLLTLATIPLTTQEYLQTARIKKERPWQDLSLQVCLPEDLAALKKNIYVLCTGIY